MADPLAERHCVEYPKGSPPLTDARVRELLGQVEGWQVVSSSDHPALSKTFRFGGFMPGVELVNAIARLAEAEGHHPDLHLRYGSLRVELWTHTVGGLSENDFILAAKMDRIRPS